MPKHQTSGANHADNQIDAIIASARDMVHSQTDTRESREAFAEIRQDNSLAYLIGKLKKE